MSEPSLSLSEATIYAAIAHAARVGQPCPSNADLGALIGRTANQASDIMRGMRASARTVAGHAAQFSGLRAP